MFHIPDSLFFFFYANLYRRINKSLLTRWQAYQLMRHNMQFVEGIIRHNSVEIRTDALEFIPAD